MIQLIPSIYIKQGKAVLPIGDLEYEYLPLSPLEIALDFKEKGFKTVEIIDIDGVETDEIFNLESIRLIKDYTQLEVFYGGGVNTDDEVRYAFEYGADKVICSSIAVKRADLFEGWLLTYGRNKIVLGVDILEDKAQGRDVKPGTQPDALEYIDGFYRKGVLYVKCSSLVATHNRLGADIALFNQIKNRFPDMKIVAAGGITSTKDIDQLREMNIYGVSFAKAWYKNELSITDLQRYL